MFCRLEAVHAAIPCVSIVVAAQRGLPALRATLDSIALQTVPPLDVTVAVPAAEAEDARALVGAILPGGLGAIVAVPEGQGDAAAMMPRLADDGAGAVIAMIAAGDVLAPDFLAATLARFGAADGAAIAAVAVRRPASRRAGAVEADGDELAVEDILRQPEPRASCFAYRREAIERIGGWNDQPGLAAQWDLHLRLVVEWRIALLPARLVACAASPDASGAAQDQAGLAGFRSMHLRHLLRQSPDQMGLLLTLAQESAASRDREAQLLQRIDQLSRQVGDLALMLARQSAWRDASAPRMYEGARARRLGYDLLHVGAHGDTDPRRPGVADAEDIHHAGDAPRPAEDGRELL